MSHAGPKLIHEPFIIVDEVVFQTISMIEELVVGMILLVDGVWAARLCCSGIICPHRDTLSCVQLALSAGANISWVPFIVTDGVVCFF